MEENPQGIKALDLNLDQEDKSITFWTDEGEQSIAVGFNSMPKGEMIMSGVGKVLTASSGAWINSNTYKLTMYNYETPHAVIYEIRFDGDKIIIDSEFNVALGNNNKQTQMVGRIG